MNPRLELWFANVSRTPDSELRIKLTVGPDHDDAYHKKAGGCCALHTAAQHREFVVDSGASHTVICPKLGQRLGLRLKSELKPYHYLDGRVGLFYASQVRLFLNSWLTIPCLIPLHESGPPITYNILGLLGMFDCFELTLSKRGLRLTRTN